MKVFISQPMNGKTIDEIREERLIAINSIASSLPDNETLEVIDNVLPPIEAETENQSRILMLGRSIQLMADADLVYFCKGWQDARGCLVEFEVSKQYNLKSICVGFDPHKTVIGKRLDAGLCD